jgi:hypothetical protein
VRGASLRGCVGSLSRGEGGTKCGGELTGEGAASIIAADDAPGVVVADVLADAVADWGVRRG